MLGLAGADVSAALIWPTMASNNVRRTRIGFIGLLAVIVWVTESKMIPELQASEHHAGLPPGVARQWRDPFPGLAVIVTAKCNTTT